MSANSVATTVAPSDQRAGEATKAIPAAIAARKAASRVA